MDDIQLLASIESYLAGEMSPTEVAVFEALRKKTPEIDQMVVEHKLFQHQMEDYAATSNIKHTLHEVHNRLLENGDVNEGGELSAKAQVFQLWNRYKRVTAIAASVGGVIALVISGLVAYFSPVVNGNQIQQLSKDIEIIKRNQQYQGREKGGSITANTPYIVGERGPELVVPHRGGTVIPNHSLSSAMGGGGQVIYNGPYIANMSAIDTQSAQQFLAKNKNSVWAANQSAARGLPASRT
jgi:hypothetical protein